jgi:hypothetical protein
MSQSASAPDQGAGTSRPRRLPTVDSEPPFDDENRWSGSDGAAMWVAEEARPFSSTAAEPSSQGALSLVFALPSGLPSVPALPSSWQPALPHPTPGVSTRLADAPEPDPPETDGPRLRLVSKQKVVRGDRPRRPRRPTAGTLEEEFGPQSTPRALLPEPQLWAARLVQAFVEVDAGLRPATQLIRWTTTSVQEAIVRPASTQQRVAERQLGEIVRSVRASEPVDGVVEVSAVVQRGGHGRCRAIALRLEGIDGRWQCTALESG